MACPGPARRIATVAATIVVRPGSARPQGSFRTRCAAGGSSARCRTLGNLARVAANTTLLSDCLFEASRVVPIIAAASALGKGPAICGGVNLLVSAILLGWSDDG